MNGEMGEVHGGGDSLGTRPFVRGRRKGSGHVPTFELSSRNVIMRGN